MLESSTDSNDLFNLFDVHVAVVDCVTHSSDGGEDCLVSCDVVRELDGVSCSAERWWCLNRGIRTWNCWWVVLFVGVVELFGSGFVWMGEADTSNIGGPVFADSEEPSDALLDSGVLLLRAYWTFGSICGSWAWRNGEWSRILFDSDNGFCVRGVGHE